MRKQLKLAVFTAVCAMGRLAFGTPLETRIDDLLRQFTLNEKIRLVGGDGFQTQSIPRLGIPAIKMTDGPLGARWARSTAFPAPIGVGASFDPDLARELGRAMAIETRALGRDMLLAPCIGIARHPLGGRNFESYGEDPKLNSLMAVAAIEGIQGEGVIASAKHFAVNDQEFERNFIDTIVDERALYEIHLPMFKAAVEAGVWSVMSSYNKINGAWASENRVLLTDILKNLWGFRGFVVSDWWSTHNTVRAANAGLDLEMPEPKHFSPSLSDAVDSGAVSVATVDDKVRRILRVMFASGLLAGNVDSKPRPSESDVSSPEQLAMAERVAAASLTLLKNDGNVLPFAPKTTRTLALIGPGARHARLGGGGSSEVLPSRALSPYEAFQLRAPAETQIRFADGVALEGDFLGIPADDWSGGVHAEYFDNGELQAPAISSRIERTVDFDWGWSAPSPEIFNSAWSARYVGKWIAREDGAQEFVARGSDGLRVRINGQTMVDAWLEQEEMFYRFSFKAKRGVAYEIVVEEQKLSGRATVGLGYSIDNPLESRPHKWAARMGLKITPEQVRSGIEEAVHLARTSDAVMIFAGDSARQEGESVDRTNMSLPRGQDELIARVLAVNSRAVDVLSGGNPTAMPWRPSAAAVLESWYPGQEGAFALADAAFGAVNPSGKLPVTFPRRWEDAPAHGAYPEDSPGSGQVTYREGIYVGYRGFESHGIEPLFPFGHGLSYTEFVYSSLVVKSKANMVHLSFRLRNTGLRTGAEAAQVYVAPVNPLIDRPLQELKAIRKLHLQPGEETLVTINLDRADFARYDEILHAWKVDAGSYEIRVGSSSRDVRVRASVQLTSARL